MKWDKVCKSGLSKFFKGCLPQNLFSLLLNTLSQIFHSVTSTRTIQFGKTIQFNIQFTWTLWSSKKTTEMEYGQIKALEIHKSKGQKKNFHLSGWEHFSSLASANTEVLFFWPKTNEINYALCAKFQLNYHCVPSCMYLFVQIQCMFFLLIQIFDCTIHIF